jgi:hypothetical protein
MFIYIYRKIIVNLHNNMIALPTLPPLTTHWQFIQQLIDTDTRSLP